MCDNSVSVCQSATRTSCEAETSLRQDFFQPLIFMNSAKRFTIPLALNMYLDPNSYNNYGGLFAMSVISLLPVIVFFIIFQRYLVDGIAMDGIKG